MEKKVFKVAVLPKTDSRKGYDIPVTNRNIIAFPQICLRWHCYHVNFCIKLSIYYPINRHGFRFADFFNRIRRTAVTAATAATISVMISMA